MADHVVRFPQGVKHGWYLGRDEVVGLLPGRERDWPAIWRRYSEQSGLSVADLRFTDEDERAEFARDLGL